MRKKRTRSRRTTLERSSLLLSVSASVALFALASSATGQEREDEDLALEEVTVVARKYEENAQDTPLALSVVTQDALLDKQLLALDEISQGIPNVEFSSGASGTGGTASAFIRGIGEEDFIVTTDPGVGVYLDGVYIARITGASLDLAEIERIEVLRGPQGTLFGRNAIGGAINVVSAKPTGEFGGRADVTVANHGTVNARASLDFPLVQDRLAAKLSVLSKQSDGWGRDTYAGADTPLGRNDAGTLGQDDDVGARAQLLWTPADNAEFLLSADYMDRNGTTRPHGMVALSLSDVTEAFNETALVPIGPEFLTEDPDHAQISAPTIDQLETLGLSLTGKLGIGGTDLTFISAFRKEDVFAGQDFDGSASGFIDQVIEVEQEQFSQEVQWHGLSFEDRLNWLLGAYYMREQADFTTGLIFTDLFFRDPIRSEVDARALFGQLTYKLTERLSFTAGLRWSEEKKQLRTQVFDIEGFPIVTVEETFDSVTPKLGVEYRFTDGVLAYASATQGFRSGGFNGRGFALSQLVPFDQEELTTYELGLKTQLANNRVRLNTAVFYNDYEDMQLTAVVLDDTNVAVTRTDNAGKARIVGAEVELEMLATAHLSLQGSVGYLDNEIESQPGFTLGSFIDEGLPFAPEWNSSIGFAYNASLPNRGRLTFGADYSYRSSQLVAMSDAVTLQQESFGLLNARISLSTDSLKGWKATLYGKNLTDEIYYTWGQAFDATVVWFGRTREYGANVAFSF